MQSVTFFIRELFRIWKVVFDLEEMRKGASVTKPRPFAGLSLAMWIVSN